MGNGFPMAALAMSKEVAAAMQKITFTTYGGNPVAMACGREGLKVIKDEMLQENALKCGTLFLDGLREL